jgi:hypothetical protein
VRKKRWNVGADAVVEKELELYEYTRAALCSDGGRSTPLVWLSGNRAKRRRGYVGGAWRMKGGWCKSDRDGWLHALQGVKAYRMSRHADR